MKYFLGLLGMVIMTNQAAFAGGSCLIIGNGARVPLSVLKPLAVEKTVIALDGAVRNLREFYHDEVKPNVILGDFDSSQKDDRDHYPRAQILHTPSQEQSDLEKGISHCIQINQSDIWLVNVVGVGRMDHTLANLNFLKRYFNGQRRIRMVTEQDIVEFARNTKLEFVGKKKQPVGVFGFSSGRVTSRGLEFPMDKYQVTLGESVSSSNYVESGPVSLEIEGEVLVSYPHPWSIDLERE